MQHFQKGDIISVEGTVRFEPESDGRLFIQIGSYDLVVDSEAAAMVRPNLEAGQMVTHGHEEATVIATHDQSVWIKAEGSGHRIVHITDLKRKEAGESA